MDLFRALGMGGGPLSGVLGGYGGGQGGMGGLSDPSAQFKAVYRCYPVVMAGASKAELEAGNKIILPSSALDSLARLRVTYPMMFKLTNKRTVSGQGRELATHCGVMEFSADEGSVYLPYWMMQNLLLESGGLVEVANVSLRKGSYVKFQPHSIKFTQLHNPRVVLERALRNFSCLTKGETIAIQHGQENFYLDVTEVKPGAAVSIIETDVNVDFDPPKDMPASTAASAAAAASSSKTGAGASSPDTSFSFNHQATNATAAQRDFSTGGWGSAGTEEEEKAAAAASAAKSASSSSSSSSSSSAAAPSASATPRTSGGGSSDYFSKLGSGNKLTGKRSGASVSGASSAASSASSSLQGSPALSAVSGARASPPPSSLGPTAASAAASKLAGSAAAAGSRPQSALAGRAGGYSLTGKPVAGSSAAGSSSSSSSAARPPSASAAASGSVSLAPTAGTTKLVERQGNWDYHYEVDTKGNKRLVRRLPAVDKPKPTAAATAAKPPTGASSSSSSSAAAPAGGLLAGKGYSLK